MAGSLESTLHSASFNNDNLWPIIKNTQGIQMAMSYKIKNKNFGR